MRATIAGLVLTAATFTPSEKAAIRAEIGETTDSCTRTPRSFPGVRIVGSFASDRGCIDVGYVNAGQVVKGLKTAGPVLAPAFARDAGARESAALAWTCEALFQNRALHRAPDSFSWPKAPAFEPPRARSDGGDVVVTVWVAEPPGMTRERRFTRYEARFSAKGDVTAVSIVEHFAEPLR